MAISAHKEAAQHSFFSGNPPQNDRLSVHFFSVAFLGFMSVAGIPAFLEERQVFMRERMNGLYGPGAYVLANSIVTLPYLFFCALLFSVICYWSIGLNPGAEQFFRFLGILFLAVYTAESQVSAHTPTRLPPITRVGPGLFTNVNRCHSHC